MKCTVLIYHNPTDMNWYNKHLMYHIIVIQFQELAYVLLTHNIQVAPVIEWAREMQ